MRKEIAAVTNALCHKSHEPMHLAYLGMVFIESHYLYAWVAGGMAVVICVGWVSDKLGGKECE